MSKEEEFDLSEKLTIEGFRDDDWFNENIWEDDLDKNEIVELVLNEVSKDVKEAVRKLKEEISQHGFTDESGIPCISDSTLLELINKIFGDKLI